MSATLPTPALNLSIAADLVCLTDLGIVNDPTGIHVAANTAAYQAILTTPPAATIVHPVGLTVYHTGLTIPASLTLVLNGLLILAPTSTAQVGQCCITITSSNVTVRISATGVLDGNMANQLATTHNVNGQGGIVTPGSIFGGGPALSDVNVFGPGLIQNTYGWPVSICNVNRTKVMFLRMIGANFAVQVVGGTTNFEFAFNYVANIPDYGFAAYLGCSLGECHDNTFLNVATVGVLNDGAAGGFNSVPCHDIVFHHNRVMNSTTWGLSALNVSGSIPAANPYNIEFSDNQLINCSIANTTNQAVIFTGNCLNVAFRRNFISGGGTVGTSNNIGIAANSTTSLHMLIEGNIIENMAVGTSLGIVVGAPGLICRDNIIRDTQATPTMNYGTFGTCGAGTFLLGNIITGMVTINDGATLVSDTVHAGPTVRTVVTGAKGGNAALASVITALVAAGLLTDSTT